MPEHCVAVTMVVDMTSAGNAGHGPSSSFGTWPPRSGRTLRSCPELDRQPGAFDLGADAEPLESEDGAAQILLADRFDDDVAVGHRREADEAPDLDVIGTDGVAWRRQRASPSMVYMLDPMP